MKKIVCFIVICTMLVPMFVFSGSAQTEYFKTFGAKYASRKGTVITDASDNVKIDGFKFSETEKGGIRAEIPDYDTFPGAYGIALISSPKATALDGMSLRIMPDEFDFKVDENNFSNQISVLWTQEVVDYIADIPYSKGLDQADKFLAKGLRNLIAEGSKGLCITLNNVSDSYSNSKTASTLTVVYYDGEYKNNENLGYEWNFTRYYTYGDPDIMPLSYDPSGDSSLYNGEYANIDTSDGLTVSIKADEKLGYIVNVNGVDYVRAYNEEKSDYEEVDLTGLKDLESGYISVGAICNSAVVEKASFELEQVNGESACNWGGGLVECEHDYEIETGSEELCTGKTEIKHTCKKCGDIYYEINVNSTPKHKGPMVLEISIMPDFGEQGTVMRICEACGATCETMPVEGLPDYKDIDRDEWYAEGVRYCVFNKYMQGTAYLEFSPDGVLSREQFVTILARVSGDDLSEYTENKFSDVEVDSWYGPSVIWAYEKGYVQGIGNGEFGTGNSITREEIATLFYRYANDDKVYSDVLEAYIDRDTVSSWAITAVNWAVSNEIIGSTSKTEAVISPKMTVTRAQAAKMIKSFTE
ncbi:MAG: S-layer homology domain-containing protein [Clostridia bacterium]|nr:S-layer homology domain-containing protein [Clostridia bacterium]